MVRLCDVCQGGLEYGIRIDVEVRATGRLATIKTVCSPDCLALLAEQHHGWMREALQE